MKKFNSAILSALLVLFSTTSMAAAISDASIDKLLALSGLNKQMEQLPGTVRAGIAQARQKGANIPDAEFTEMTNIIVNSFQPANMIKAIRTELKNNLTTADSKALLSWYESKEGKMIASTEEAASTPESYNQMIKDAKTLLADEKKLAMARRIENALNSVDMAMQIQENTGIAVYTAIMTAVDPTKKPEVEPFRSQMSAQYPQIRARLEQFIHLTLIHSYKNVDDATMNKYAAFLEKPATRKFNKGVMEGMTNAIKFSTELMAQDMAQLFKSAAAKQQKK